MARRVIRVRKSLGGRRAPILVVLLAGTVAVSATVFGLGFAPRGHNHEAGTGQIEDGHAEEATGAGGGEIASAVFISLAAGALIPLTLLAVRRREPDVVRAELDVDEPVPQAGAAQISVALLSLGAAVVHFAVIAQHFDEWWLTGTFFVATAVFQLGWAFFVLVRPSTLVYVAGALVNALIVITWIVSRTTGVPVGPNAGEAESVGLPDTVATGFEVALVLLLLPLLAARTTARPLSQVRRVGSWAAGAVVVSLTALALATLA
jgi:hypothetical protein